jgi:hypothetical protein
MDRRLGFRCGALVALLVLAISIEAAFPQTTPSCTGGACGTTLEQPWAAAREIYQRKQEFVAALRQLSIALTGHFGDEGRSLRTDIDSLDMALRRWDQAIVAFEKDRQQRGSGYPIRVSPLGCREAPSVDGVIAALHDQPRHTVA